MKIGILGGGQLARMLIEENNKYAFEFFVLAKEKGSPAGQITPNEFICDWNNDECLKAFAEKCDVLTLENEFIDFKKLQLIENTGRKLFPSSETIRLIQDKLYQKEFLKRAGIPVAPFTGIEKAADIITFADVHGFPLILKSRTMGYDGKGNLRINSAEDAETSFDSLSKRGKLMCESFINFEKEIATQVARRVSGEVKVYPVVETIQKDHICHTVIASKDKKEHENSVFKIAERVAEDLNYAGVIGIELFLTSEGILVNELAPRVHNTGHYTIEGCRTSQFENHLRAILDLPLGSTDMTAEHAVMVNILGERTGKAEISRVDEVIALEDTFVHIYGKKEVSPGRKMGHITSVGNDACTVYNNAIKARERFGI